MITSNKYYIKATILPLDNSFVFIDANGTPHFSIFLVSLIGISIMRFRQKKRKKKRHILIDFTIEFDPPFIN